MYEDLIAIFPDLLQRHVHQLAIRGDQARGVCPFHDGAKNMSFAASLSKGGWQCFSCGEKGNVMEFASRVGEALPHTRPPVSPLYTMSTVLQREAEEGFQSWKKWRYLTTVEDLGCALTQIATLHDEVAWLEKNLVKYSLNPEADELEAKDEWERI